MQGMEKMLKMFGFDIDELKAQVGPKIEEMQQMATRFDETQQLILKQNQAIIENQQILYQLLVAGKVIPTMEDFAQLHRIEPPKATPYGHDGQSSLGNIHVGG